MNTAQVEVLSFGEAALALDITIELMLSLLVQRVDGLGTAMLAELDALLAAKLPTPGTQAAIQRLRDHVQAAGEH